MTQREALNELRAIVGETAFIEHGYFSPARRNMWFVGFRRDDGAPIVRGQSPSLIEAIEDVKRYYASGTPAQQKGRER